MKTDIEIAQSAEMLPIMQVADRLGIDPSAVEMYGHYKAKIDVTQLNSSRTNGRLILVTAMSPTPAGEGKSTTTIGLADALNKIHPTMIALREPSLGPVMGIKGGAAGGGYAQVVPMEDINLHFTGDMHALTSAHNTLSALIDNHIHQGNALDLDVRRIRWKRVVDINDRALRQVTVGLGGISNGYPRQDGFDITVASEMMAILCLAKDLKDLELRISRIAIGQNRSREWVFVKDLGCQGALTLLLKDAIKPNLVQSLEQTPALVHGGPFANIAHGCNSVIATRTALSLADYVVTEAGFGADLGAEKFLDIKVPELGQAPDCIVLVATIRSLKMHGGVPLKELNDGENSLAVQAGFANLAHHIKAMQSYNRPVVVAINAFATDTPSELELVQTLCQQLGVPVYVSNAWAEGSVGTTELAHGVIQAIDSFGQQGYHPLIQPEDDTVEAKLRRIATTIYGADDIEFTQSARKNLREIIKAGWNHLPVCVAKTQYSLTDNPKLLAEPKGFAITIRELIPKPGAGFIVALTGDVLTMPGLPKHPAAMDMGIDQDGKIYGLF